MSTKYGIPFTYFGLGGISMPVKFLTTLDVQARAYELGALGYSFEWHAVDFSHVQARIMDHSQDIIAAHITGKADETFTAKVNTMIREFHSHVTMKGKADADGNKSDGDTD